MFERNTKRKGNAFSDVMNEEKENLIIKKHLSSPFFRENKTS